MADTLHITAAAPARTSSNYAALRDSGMAWIRRWAQESWTDHNVHDPGITLLEAYCYAMTELGLRLDVDMADLLASGSARALPRLPPAHRVLPMAPVTAEDLRRVLLDHPLVSDAQIFEPADNEVAFYASPGNDPPLTFTPGTGRVRTHGLYEVLVELADRDLNTNTYGLTVNAGGQPYDIELALPFWDDLEAAAFQQAATVTAATMLLSGGTAWRALPEPQSHFGRLQLDYTDGGGAAGSVDLWVLLRVATPLVPVGVTPGVLAAAQAEVESVAAGAPLLRFVARVRAAAAAVDGLRSFLAAWRNLGQQAVRIGLARVQDIAVRATLEVTGGVDLELLLARIFMDIDALLSPRLRFEALAARRAGGAGPEQVYDGPLLRRGFLTTASSTAVLPSVVYTSDVLRMIMQRRSGAGMDAGSDVVAQENPVGRDIVAVTELTLANFINNRVITARAQDCLHLVEIQRYRPRLSLAKSRITTVRNDTELHPDLARVQALLVQLRANADAATTAADTSPVWAVAQGEVLPLDAYTPLQLELPALYGVGNAALPDSAGPERHAAARQLGGYLLPVEQLLGDVTAQLGNINRFFSGDADEPASCFVRAPFDLPGAHALLRQAPADGNWAAFVADPDNPVLQALRQAAESPDRRLDRRNRMLDHLLARQGEDALAMAQETTRWAMVELSAQNLPAAAQEAHIAARRQAASARVLQAKAGLLRELPELNAGRLLAHSNPFAGDAPLLRVEAAGPGFVWFVAPQGSDALRAAAPLPSLAAAGIAAERAFHHGARAANYQVVAVAGGQQRLRVVDTIGAVATPLGESTQAYPSVAAANAALPALVAALAGRLVASSLSPMERRIAHHCGIRAAARRPALTPTGSFFDIATEPAPAGLVGKRWRLRGPLAGGGAVLLVSAQRFDAATDPQALALAEAGIAMALRWGMDAWNYTVEPSGGSFDVTLRAPDGTLLATRDVLAPTRVQAEAALAATVDHLVLHYAAETLCLVDHVVLRPRAAGDAFLSLPMNGGAPEPDPYSQRLTLVLPSGRVRDFATGITTPSTPHRFRDPAFRRHLEGIVQRVCPAHLLATVRWVDRQTPGAAAAASHDSFEASYFAWLDSVLIPGAAPAAADNARNALVQALNDIAHDTNP